MSPRARILFLLAPVVLGLGSGGSVAQATGPSEARKLFKEGKKAYAEGRFAAAAEKFAKGYQLDPQPAFLLNQAQSERSAGDRTRAREHYQEFLRVQPSSRLKPQVEDLLNELDREIAADEARKARAAEEKLEAEKRARALVAPPPEERDRGTTSREGATFYRAWWFWTIVGVAVVGTTVAVSSYAATREPVYLKEGGLGTVRW
jgi:tetratricopeptide (TPR) repeat protein